MSNKSECLPGNQKVTKILFLKLKVFFKQFHPKKVGSYKEYKDQQLNNYILEIVSPTYYQTTKLTHVSGFETNLGAVLAKDFIL